MNDVDVVVTCGGTIGLEFAYMGKPVVLAAKAPYSGFGFTIEPNSVEDYEGLLKNSVGRLPKLTEKQKDMANKVIYHDFVLQDNYSDDLEIGGQRFYLGREFDYNSFYEQILIYNTVSLDEQLLYKKLKNFINSESKHMLVSLFE